MSERAKDSQGEFSAESEIPKPLRQMAQDSVATARQTANEFSAVLDGARDQATRTQGEIAASAIELQAAAYGMAEDNISKGLDMAMRMARASDLEELLRLQSEFTNTQIDAFQRQAEQIGQMFADAAGRVSKTIS